jgi:hypothetical protein
LVLSYLASKPSLRVRSGALAVTARPAALFASFVADGNCEQLAMTAIDHNGTKVWPLSPKDRSTG